MNTKERVLAKISEIKKKPLRAKVISVKKKVKRVNPNGGLDKYSLLLKKLGDHFGERAIPDLLAFIVNRKEKESKQNLHKEKF